MAYNEIYRQISFETTELKVEYESCVFVNCIFSNVSGITFSDCTFQGCNLSNVQAKQTAFRDCAFKECKLMGINFSRTKDFGFVISFMNCNLSYSSFDQKNLNKSSFIHCNLQGANFTQANLSKCIVSDCDCFEAVFDQTNLSGIDFTTNTRFLINPNQNHIKKTKFAMHTLPQLLYIYDIIIE